MILRSGLLCAGIVLLSLSASPAHAIFNVVSTGIEEGVAGIESRNRFDHDDRVGEDGFRADTIKLDYGITKRWQMELALNWEDIPQHGYNYASTEVESKFRFYDPGDYWLDFSMKLAYEIAHESGVADAAKTKLQFAKKFEKWDHTANLNFSKEVGKDATKDITSSFAWRTRYAANEHFKPSIEYFASLGEWVDMPSYNDQAHRIGPVVYGNLTPEIGYKLGYLFGLSKAAEDGSFKAFLSYEFML